MWSCVLVLLQFRDNGGIRPTMCCALLSLNSDCAILFCNIAHIPATAFLRYCRDRYRPLMPYHVEHLSYPAVERISDQRIRDLSKAVSFRPMCIRSSLSALEIGIYPWRSLPGALWVLSRSRSSQRSRLTRGYRFPLVTGSPSRSAYPPWWCCPKESFHCESVT